MNLATARSAPVEQHEPPALPPPPRLLPPGYQWVRKLCDGGMSQLYLARRAGRHQFAKLFVVKTLSERDQAQPQSVARMISEARLTAELNHPNLVQVFDAGELGARAFIVMEYLHGVDLRAILARLGTAKQLAPLGLICRIVADALAGLDHAHAQPLGRHKEGIIHRDVSPSNVMVTFAGHTKMIDFGIARDYRTGEADATRDSGPEGKPAYMSPEQVLCLPLDRRSDLFSMGVVLWEGLTGRRLFARASDRETLAAVLAAPVVPPSRLRATVPAALDAVVERALARDCAQRFASAKQMRADLERLVARCGWSSSTADVETWLAELFAGELQSERRSMHRAGVGSYEEYLLATGIDREPARSDGEVREEIVGELSPVIPIFVEPERPAADSAPAPPTVPLRLRRLPSERSAGRWRAPLAVAGLVACALAALGGVAWRSRMLPRLVASARRSLAAGAAPATAATTAAANVATSTSAHATPSANATAGADAATTTAAAAEPSDAPTDAAPPATLELRADHRCEFFVDDALVAVARRASVRLAAGGAHRLTYRRVGHRTLHALELPPLAADQVETIVVRVAAPGEAP